MIRSIRNSLSMLALLLFTDSCSTYKQNGKCYDYKPVGCLFMSARLVCETNSEGCETCNCIPAPQGK